MADAGAEGMRDTGIDFGLSASSAIVPGLPAPVARAARSAGDVVDAASTAKRASNAAPDFVVTPSGTAYPVPKGAVGPKSVTNRSGKTTGTAFTGGSGGQNGQVNTIRIMDPTTPRGASPGYPNGYIKYENKSKQAVDPYTGKTLPRDRSHFGIDR